MNLAADYVTEREACAIRGMPFGNWLSNHCNMTVEFKDNVGRFEVPRDLVTRYWYDWERSGMWSLPGTKDADPALITIPNKA